MKHFQKIFGFFNTIYWKNINQIIPEKNTYLKIDERGKLLLEYFYPVDKKQY